MTGWSNDGRVYRQELKAIASDLEDGRVELCSPAVGLWRHAPVPGTLVGRGAPIGELEILGRLVWLRAPAGATGLVVELPEGPPLARRPVAWRDRLMVLDPKAVSGAAQGVVSAAEADTFEGLVLRSPSSGRLYARPAPDKPPFVVEGAVIEWGQTVALLEVMKTFNRIQYGGEGLPDRALVTRVAAGDESDLEAGDVILELEDAP